MTSNSDHRAGSGRDIVLIAGLWLPSSVWGPVVTELEHHGHRTVVPALPGVGDGATETTLDDQLDAVLAVVDDTDHPLVVGHSAACTLAWLAADRRPTSIARTALIGGFPTTDGERYADFFPLVDGQLPFPGWEPFEGPDAADLDDAARAEMAAITVAVPGGVAQAVVRLHDERRFDVPTTLVCPEFGPDDARAWIGSGDLPELARATQVHFVDLDSGHWPMITRPTELAQLLHDIAAGL